MPGSVLGSSDLTTNVPQAIYYCDNNVATIVSVNICNRGEVDVTVKIAVCADQYSPTDAEWVLYNYTVSPTSSVEKRYQVSPGKFLVVVSNNNQVSAVAWGVTQGDQTTTSPIALNLWPTDTYTFSTGRTYNYTLPIGGTGTKNVSIISGSMPTGLSLSSTGVVTGTMAGTGYTPGIADANNTLTINATDSNFGSSTRTIYIKKRWADGSTAARAAVSAEHIRTLTGTSTNGNYWIDIGNGPFQTYCLMSLGGYMLAGKISSNVDGTSWDYFGPYWSGTKEVGNTTDLSDTDAVNQLYWSHLTTQGFLLGMGTPTNYVSVALTARTAKTLFTGTEVNLDSVLSRTTMLNWIINTGGVPSTTWDNQPNSNRIRVNSKDTFSGVGMRFGITMNNEADDNSNDSAIGFGVYTNNYSNPTTQDRNIKSGGFGWNPTGRYPRQGFIFVR